MFEQRRLAILNLDALIWNVSKELSISIFSAKFDLLFKVKVTQLSQQIRPILPPNKNSQQKRFDRTLADVC